MKSNISDKNQYYSWIIASIFYSFPMLHRRLLAFTPQLETQRKMPWFYAIFQKNKILQNQAQRELILHISLE
jgi:hypothetical protein